jgi:hypothetical protein
MFALIVPSKFAVEIALTFAEFSSYGGFRLCTYCSRHRGGR